MKLGVAIFPHAGTLEPAELGRRVEAAGFESLFVPEHSHIPVDGTEYPGGGDIPDVYRAVYAPFVTLAAVAASTSSLKLGTGVCLVAQRDPIHLAKDVATLDVLSGGRVLLGVGAGWNVAELRHHGVEPRQRWRVLDERVAAAKAIWSDDQAEYHGRHVDFAPMWQWPKPLQRPHPPLLVGGNSDGAMQRAVRLEAAWLPRARRSQDRFAQDFARFRALAAAAGRDDPGITVYEAQPDREYLAFYAAQGIERCVFMLDAGAPDDVRRQLDELAELAVGDG